MSSDETVTSVSTPIDWAEIKAEAARIKQALRSIKLLDSDDFEALRLSRLTYGLVEPPLWLTVDYGQAFYIHDRPDTLIRELWVEIVEEAGGVLSPSLLPPARVRSRRVEVDHFGAVDHAVKLRTASASFLRSWTRLHVLHDRFLLLSTQTDASRRSVDQALAGSEVAGIEVQKHWYAQWVWAHVRSFTPERRKDPGQALGMLCRDIIEGKTLPWGPYPIDWYARVLGREADDVGGSFQKLGEPMMHRMIHHSLLTPEVLPPLSRSGFKVGPLTPGGGGA